MKYLKNTIIFLVVVVLAFNGSLILATTNSHSIDSDGTGDFLSNTTGFTFSDVSICGWYNMDNAPGAFDIHGLAGQAATDELTGWVFFYENHDGTNNRLEFRFIESSDPSNGRSANNILASTDTWYHVCATVDVSAGGAGVTIYVDNSTTTDGSPTDDATSIGGDPQDIAIGARRQGPENVWDGLYDEIAIYDDILTAGEVDDLFNQDGNYCDLISTDANLLAYYRLNNTAVSVPAGTTLTLNADAAYNTGVPFASDTCGGAAGNNNQIL